MIVRVLMFLEAYHIFQTSCKDLVRFDASPNAEDDGIVSGN